MNLVNSLKILILRGFTKQKSSYFVDYQLFNTTLNGVLIKDIEDKIYNGLIDNEFFIPEHWNIPRIGFVDSSQELDHEFHEYYSLEVTDNNSTELDDISDLLNIISR